MDAIAVRVVELLEVRRLLTVNEVGEALPVSRATTYRLLDSGELGGVRVGGQLRVPDTELQAYLDTHRLTPGRPE